MPDIAIALIKPGKNPRTYFDPQEMDELANSVRSVGILQPILLKPLGDTGEYEIVAGERRWRAAQLAGLAEIPAIVREFSDDDAEVAAVTENIQRANMAPSEEAEAANRLLYRNQGDKEETARQLGWTLEKLGKRLALMSCAPEVRASLTERKIQLGHAELLAAVPADKQVKALKRIIEGNISVGTLKDNLSKLAHKLAAAIFDTAQCQNCQYNSSQQRSLGFSENIGDGYCTNGEHYEQLTSEKLEAIAAEKREDFPKVVIYRKEDGFQPLPLSADGALGVGPEQAEACKACANFGCAISGLPGSEGEVTESLCFDAGCNQQKVAARIKAEKARNPLTMTMRNAAAATGGKPVDGRTKLAAKANAVPKAVAQYRVEQWRKIAAKELHMQPDKAQSLLFGLALTGHLNYVDQSRYRTAVERMLDDLPKAPNLTDGMEFAHGLEPDHRTQVLGLIPCAAAYGVPEHELTRILSYLDASVATHWKLNKEFLALMSKSEIEAVAEEIGLKKAMKDFAKAKGEKKDDFIAALLKVDGFEYRSAVPKVMLYDKKTRTASCDAEDEGGSEQSLPEPATTE